VKKFNKKIALFLMAFLPTVLLAQLVTGNNAAPQKPTSADIHEAIKKLNVLGSVLYVAAHPDDENTRMITYLANARHYDVTYLSLTRGDGGQNLIGTEMREMLGVLRTQELLAARRVDGGNQLFSRANDFGFSKTPTETFDIWQRTEVLSDAVWAIRKTQPDIMINRFSTDTTIDTHGHHTASAIVGAECFDISAKKTAFPEQFDEKNNIVAWQPRRIFCNQSWFFYGSQDSFQRVMNNGGGRFLKIDIGEYYPAKGKSNDEIAAESRSMHRCQAMGTAGNRGEAIEYLEYLKGDQKPATDPFEGINTTWTRLEGGAAIGELMKTIAENFKYDNPAASVKDLLKARKMIQNLPNGFWKTKKLKDIENVIRACGGIFFEATTKENSVVTGGKVEINYEIISRSDLNISVESIEPTSEPIQKTLAKNKVFKTTTTVPMRGNVTAPYWLLEKPTIGMYKVTDQQQRGLPETPHDFATATLKIEGEIVVLTTPIVNKIVSPAKGEIYRPLEVTPPVYLNFEEKVYVFSDEKTKKINIILKSATNDAKGKLKLETPAGWSVEQAEMSFELKQKGDEKIITFVVQPPKNASESNLSAVVTLENGANASKSVRFIEYDHIPTQTILLPAEAKIVKLDLKKYGSNIGYLMGAGDEMPTFIEQMGYKVTILDEKQLDYNGESTPSVGNTGGGSLNRFDAIVIGIRAYNTKEKLKIWNKKFFDYVEQGGVLVVQYNTNGRDLVMKELAPYPMQLSRERVTEENAAVRILKPQHIALNAPNKIAAYDFQGWVQERGLYFPNKWDEKFDALLSCNDMGEKPLDGSLLVAKHGKGYYVYTGLSFFRQLPAGVGGAYRLFANLLSLGGVRP
jgi:LmbE family N-acetylglucosaminyl deacetylase